MGIERDLVIVLTGRVFWGDCHNRVENQASQLKFCPSTTVIVPSVPIYLSFQIPYSSCSAKLLLSIECGINIQDFHFTLSPDRQILSKHDGFQQVIKVACALPRSGPSASQHSVPRKFEPNPVTPIDMTNLIFTFSPSSFSLQLLHDQQVPNLLDIHTKR